MELEKAIHTRRTHKAFGPRELERSELDALFELARWAPNHNLTNPWRFRVLGPQTRAALMELAESEKPGAAAKLARAPTLVCVTALLDGDAAQNRDDLLATAAAAYIVLLAAQGRGLASYWRTVELLEDPRGREMLSLTAQETPLGLLYLGDPIQEQRVPEREPLEQLVSHLR
jgi:nitroreductase